jgi:hypothetical protein
MATWLGYQDVSSASNVAAQLQLGYNGVSRNGNSVSFTFDIHVNYTGSWSKNGAGAWYGSDYRKCNASNASYNYDYYASSGGTSQGSNFFSYSGTVNTNDTSVAITIGFANKATSPITPLIYVTYYIPIPAVPAISIYESSRTHNSITLGYNYSGIAPNKIQMNNGSSVLGEYTGNPFTISGLSSNTTYSDLKGYGYSNSTGWGGVSNSLSIKTYPAPVTISSLSVTDITPFTCTVSMAVSSINDVQSTEYSIYNSTGTTLIQSPFVDTPGVFSKAVSSLNPETTYQVKARVRTKESSVWSSYSTVSFTTLTDQSQGWIKYSSNWVKGKVYIRNNGIWSEAKETYIKVSGTWRDTTNN